MHTFKTFLFFRKSIENHKFISKITNYGEVLIVMIMIGIKITKRITIMITKTIIIATTITLMIMITIMIITMIIK